MEPCQIDKDGLLRLENQLCFALYSTSRAFTKVYRTLLKEIGVTYPQYLALLVLWKQDGILVSDIASALEIDNATATPLIQRLEKLSLVVRLRNMEDERQVRIFLTDKGKESYKKALDVPHGLGCATGLTIERAQSLIEELKTIKNFIGIET